MSVKGLLALDMDDPYVTELIKEEFSRRQESWTIAEPEVKKKVAKRGDDVADDEEAIRAAELDFQNINNASTECFIHPSEGQPCLQWAEYERVDWDDISAGKCSTIWYMHRKGLIRKANLASSIATHISICPNAKKEECTMYSPPKTVDSDDDDSSDYDSSDYDTSSDEEQEGEDEKETTDDQVPSESEAESQHDHVSSSKSISEGEIQQQPEGVFVKTEGCPLQTHVPETYYFELRSADELDELLICELPEINALDNYSEEENFARGDVWILKPSIMNQAREIHVIASKQAFVDALSNPDVEDVREWVIQRYISNPLLISGGRKFHIRAHVVAVGNCTAYLMDRMLALFSLHRYEASVQGDALNKHITNVCYQKGKFLPPKDENGNTQDLPESKFVLMLDEAFTLWAKEQAQLRSDGQVPSPVYEYFEKLIFASGETPSDKLIGQYALNHISEQIRLVLSEAFPAAMGIHNTAGMLPSICSHQSGSDADSEAPAPTRVSGFRMANYNPLDNCAELYGVDFMVDETFKVSLLEFNAGPDFGQTGQRLKELAIKPLIHGMTEVLLQKVFPSLAALDTTTDTTTTTTATTADQEGKTVSMDGTEEYTPMSCIGAGVKVPGLPSAPHFIPVFHINIEQ